RPGASPAGRNRDETQFTSGAPGARHDLRHDRLRGLGTLATVPGMSATTPTPAYSVRLRVRMPNQPGMLGRVAVAIGDVDANITGVEGFSVKGPYLEDDLT